MPIIPSGVSLSEDTLVKKPVSQAAATFTSLDSVRNLLWLKYNPIINFPAGVCTIDLSNVYSPITIVGDTRPLAGHAWCHGIAVRSTKTEAGAGIVSLSQSDNDIIISCSVTNPNLTGWQSGDYAIIVSAAGLLDVYEITAVVGNRITLSTSAPNVASNEAEIVLVPNRQIISPLVVPVGLDLVMQGFLFNVGVADSVTISGNSKIHVDNGCFYNTTAGIIAKDGAIVELTPENSFVDTDYGMYLQNGSRARIDGVSFYKATSGGILCAGSSTIWSEYVRLIRNYVGASFDWNSGSEHFFHTYAISNSTSGIEANRASSVLCNYSHIERNNYGLAAVQNSHVRSLVIGSLYGNAYATGTNDYGTVLVTYS